MYFTKELSATRAVVLAPFFLAAMFITGCATSYKEPNGEKVASIEFINEASEPMSLHLHGGAEECTDRMSAGTVQGKSERKLVVPSAENVVFTVGMTPNGTSIRRVFGIAGLIATAHKGCTPTIDFTPETGRSYVFRINSDGNDCNYQFYLKPSASQQPEEVVPVAFTKRDWIRAMSESGPFCKKK